MRAVHFAAPLPTYLLTRAAGLVSERLHVGPHACTRYGDVPSPELPGDRWVRVRTRLGGVCGSDLGLVGLTASPQASPFSSFPFVLGHENVGTVVEAGRAVRAVALGTRVTANPLLCCEPRGLAPCAACAAGDRPRCARFTDGPIAPGMFLGLTRGLGGSWGEEFVAHESQLVPVPDHVRDEEAVMVEPLACAVHAVRGAPPLPGERVVVIGAGTIGLVTVAALAALAPSCRVTVAARHPAQAAHARRLGAAHVVEGRGDVLPALADDGGVRLLRPMLGRPVGVGGFDRAYVCVGGRDAVDDAARVTRAGGTLVLLGAARTLDGFDWTPLWLKELTVRGVLGYGDHPAPGGGRRGAFAEAAELVATGRAPLGPLVTHTFPLAEYRAALAAARGKGASASVKVAFRH